MKIDEVIEEANKRNYVAFYGEWKDKLIEWLEELKHLQECTPDDYMYIEECILNNQYQKGQEDLISEICQIIFEGEDTEIGRKVTIDRIKEYIEYQEWLKESPNE